jgi:hypothetical protein
MVGQILRESRVRSFYLLEVLASRSRVISSAAQFEAQAVFVKVPCMTWKPRSMMRSHKPGRHPAAACAQVGHSCVDVVPRHPFRPAPLEYRLVIRVELAQVVKRGGCLDAFDETRRRLTSVAQQCFRALPRPGTNARNMLLVIIRFSPRLSRRMRQEVRASKRQFRLS